MLTFRAAMNLHDTAVSLATTPTEAIARLETALTDENDCSRFAVTITGGPDPVTVMVTPGDMRAMLATL